MLWPLHGHFPKRSAPRITVCTSKARIQPTVPDCPYRRDRLHAQVRSIAIAWEVCFWRNLLRPRKQEVEQLLEIQPQMEMQLLVECSSLSDAPIYNAVISSLPVFREDYPVLLKSVSNPEPIARGNIFRTTSLRLAPPRPKSQKPRPRSSSLNVLTIRTERQLGVVQFPVDC